MSQELYFLSEEIHVIALKTSLPYQQQGWLIYIIRKYGTTVEPFADKLEQNSTQVEDVKQVSIKHIRDASDSEKSQQALVQKCHYLFDVQRNNTAMTLESTYRKWLYKVY